MILTLLTRYSYPFSDRLSTNPIDRSFLFVQISCLTDFLLNVPAAFLKEGRSTMSSNYIWKLEAIVGSGVELVLS